MAGSKTIEEKYKSLTDVEHILLRPGTYVGSTVLCDTCKEYLYDAKSGKFSLEDVRYVPAFLKLFDEIVSNSIDESRRNKKLDTIKVEIDRASNTISVYDNGGIPVVIHKEANQYVPEFIFSRLRAGSNFDDTEQRGWVGTNGFGSTLTNVFSTEFTVETCDGKNLFAQTFTDNMSRRTKPVIKPSRKGHTTITYKPDLKRFGLDGIDDTHYRMMEKRLYDASATNPSVGIYFNGRKIEFGSFADYCSMYADGIIFEKGRGWEVGFAPSETFRHISLVNSAMTRDGGTHVNYIADQVVNYLRERIRKKHRIDLKPSEIKNHLFIFISCTVNNPSYSSQTKEKLITEPKNFGTSHIVSEKTLKDIFASEITQTILDWVNRRNEADEKAAVRAANKSLSKEKISKLVEAKGRDRRRCSLMLCEGDSPMAGFRKYRNPETQGAFPLRGKSLNVRELSEKKAIENQEIKSIMGALGLKFGVSPFTYGNDGKLLRDNLRYGEVWIYSDADVDGISCASLLVNFFERFFPELIREHRIARCETPVIIATSKSSRKCVSFYYEDEWDEWQKKNDVSKWNISYKKGLAALTDEEYAEIIRKPRLYYYELTDASRQKLEVWFGGDSDARKKAIAEADIAREYIEPKKETKRREQKPPERKKLKLF